MDWIRRLKRGTGNSIIGLSMCEFRVFLAGQLIFEDVVYAKLQGSDLVLRDILGSQKTIPRARIVEVDVNSERLLLEITAI